MNHRHSRFSVIAPGRTQSELLDQKEGAAEGFTAMFGEVEALPAEDVAEAAAFIVTNARRVAVNEIVIRPADQP